MGGGASNKLTQTMTADEEFLLIKPPNIEEASCPFSEAPLAGGLGGL